MEFEIIVKAILALFILVVLIGLIYIFVIDKGAGGMHQILNQSLSSAGNVMDSLKNLVGG